MVNPVLAVGLLRFSPIVRRFALAWYALLSLVAIVAMVWLYYYRVPIDPARWPEQVASKIMPIFLARGHAFAPDQASVCEDSTD